jgi:subtilisin-like proprotein convertase family protein
MKVSLTIGTLCLSAGLALGQTTSTHSTSVNQAIPDGNPVGLVSSINLTGFANDAYITAISVTLDITGGYNGDLYAYLVGPNGGFAVLLNRTGVGGGDHFGYGDAGFSITLDDNALNNVHYYRTADNPNGGPLTGTWQPDGENVDPTSSDVGSAQATAMLSSFYNSNPNGTWQLFVADLSNGETSQMVSWSMSITVVPEPNTLAFAGMGLLALLAAARWKQNNY